MPDSLVSYALGRATGESSIIPGLGIIDDSSVALARELRAIPGLVFFWRRCGDPDILALRLRCSFPQSLICSLRLPGRVCPSVTSSADIRRLTRLVLFPVWLACLACVFLTLRSLTLAYLCSLVGRLRGPREARSRRGNGRARGFLVSYEVCFVGWGFALLCPSVLLLSVRPSFQKVCESWLCKAGGAPSKGGPP